ncbi:unnamed protein product [Clonostachys rosea]|uniref:Cytochrome P450 n=1 Tax=Bionectria ochroleuca TaxID=29856 RepID=A0ABY6UTR0_BIOOC|nr:unnamed protein product [Clonostachys rosea]
MAVLSASASLLHAGILGTKLQVPHLAALLVLLLALHRYILQPAFLSPLSKVPAVHWSCHLCPAWLWWARLYGWENRKTYEAHQTHGPVVRIAPNQLSVNSYDDGLKKIYLGNYPKSSFYPIGFSNYGQSNMFTMAPAQHGSRKKLFSNTMSKSAILASQSAREISKVLLFERLLPMLHESSKRDEPLEIPGLTYSYSMDSFANWQFGLSNGCNLLQNVNERNSFLNGFFGSEAYTVVSTKFPWAVYWLAKIGIRVIPKAIEDGVKDIEDWNMKQCDRAAQSIQQDPHPKTVDQPTVFAQALKTMGAAKAGSPAGPRSGNDYPNRLDIASEMSDFNFAAHETSGNTLIYVLYELSRRPLLQKDLYDSLHGVSSSLKFPESLDDPLPLYRDVDTIPLLDAIILETLRLYPSVQGAQPRVTPKDTTMGPFQVPQGVLVQSYAYHAHRNQDAFPDPEKWDPERWLRASPEQLVNMRKWFWAFGSGASMCIGSNFALLSMKMVTAAIFSNFTTTIYEHGDMELADAYLAGPRGGKLLLKFHLRDKEVC